MTPKYLYSLTQEIGVPDRRSGGSEEIKGAGLYEINMYLVLDALGVKDMDESQEEIVLRLVWSSEKSKDELTGWKRRRSSA